MTDYLQTHTLCHVVDSSVSTATAGGGVCDKEKLLSLGYCFFFSVMLNAHLIKAACLCMCVCVVSICSGLKAKCVLSFELI